MTVKTIEFSYTVGSTRFQATADVDSAKWDSMDEGERIQTLEDAALEEVSDMIDIEEDSINDE